jgi:hypothetical protein
VAADFLEAIEADESVLALHIARGLLTACSGVRERHRGALGKQGRKLDIAADSIANVSRGIQEGYSLTEFVHNAQKVLRDINGLSGVLSRRIEEES